MEKSLLDSLFDELFPLMRSITGPGIRKSLDILARVMPLKIETVPSGTRVFDWTVPPEWTIRQARLTAPDGTIVADADIHTLHVVNYSEPIDLLLSLEELQPHLYSLPDLPGATLCANVVETSSPESIRVEGGEGNHHE